MNDKRHPLKKSDEESENQNPQDIPNSTNQEYVRLILSNEDGERIEPRWVVALRNLPPEIAQRFNEKMEALNIRLEKKIKVDPKRNEGDK